MCGITGFYLFKNSYDHGFLIKQIKKMNELLIHRGPDAKGIWSDYKDKIYLGHRRLSIIDLSSKANQPMRSYNGRYVIIFNGEIYNFLELKNLLKDVVKFKDNSDTRVLLELINYFGFSKALKHINGMFSFALWDVKEKTLYLAIDRFGKKPLYWTDQNQDILFSSELKSIVSFYTFKKRINYKALSFFFKYSYIKAPQTIYESTYKVEPGTFLKIDKKKKITKHIYWSTPSNEVDSKLLKIPQDEIETKLSDLVDDSVRSRMVSDVPLGVMLSGGIDSSLIAAIAQKFSKKKIDTFSISFPQKGFDESKFAKRVAKELSTTHNTFSIDDYYLEDLVGRISYHYDEPFADSSQIPSMIIAKELKKKVTVALTGDGGDEIFGGYSRYVWGGKISKFCNFFPLNFRKTLSKLILNLPSNKLNLLNKLFPIDFFPSQFGDRLKKIGKIIICENNFDIYQKLVIQSDKNFLKNKTFYEIENFDFPVNLEISEAMQRMDITNYLPGDILVKIDRSSMAYGLELRSPLLDYRLLEFSNKFLVKNNKIRNNKGKYLLRKILSKYIPKDLINRPKMGFAIPLATFLRTNLEKWMLDVLSKKKIEKQGILDGELVSQTIEKHLSLNSNNHYEIWNLLMFQTWFDRWMK